MTRLHLRMISVAASPSCEGVMKRVVVTFLVDNGISKDHPCRFAVP